MEREVMPVESLSTTSCRLAIISDSTPPLSTIRDMDDHSGLAHFQALFEPALQAYEKRTSIALAEHPTAVQLRCCRSVDTLLHQKTHAFINFRGSDRIVKSVETTVSKLITHSATASLSEEAFGLGRRNALMDLPHLNRFL